MRYFALVDSGADLSFFGSEIADIIGIDLAAGIRKNVSGVVAGESRAYYLHQVEIEVGGHAKLTEVAFMPNLYANGHGLLGRGFFNRFTFVKFEHAKGTVEVGAAL